MEKLVSIVVTSYNHAEFLHQRMESLFAQTWKNIEIIVVDDCSTDLSRDYLKQFENYPKVRLCFLESNKGYVYASNFGVSQSKGELIVFAECDDFSEPDQIESLYKEITSNNSISVCFSGSNIIDEKGRHLGFDFDERNWAFQKFCQSDVLISGKQLLKMMLQANVVRNMSAAMFKKSDFNRIEGLTEKYQLSADYDLWIRMAEVGDFFYIKKPLNNFRTHPTTLRNKLGTTIQLLEMLDIIRYIKTKIRLSFRENWELNMHLGKRWFHFVKNEFNLFRTTFSTVFLKALQKEPLLIPFIILNIPVLGAKKILKAILPIPEKWTLY